MLPLSIHTYLFFFLKSLISCVCLFPRRLIPSVFQKRVLEGSSQAGLTHAFSLPSFCLCTIIFPPSLCVVPNRFTHDLSSRSSPYFSSVLKPVWTYGIQIWGCTSQSNRNIIQRFQNRLLRGIIDAPWYIRNDNLHNDLDVETVDSVIKKYAQSHEKRLQRHINVEALQLLNSDGLGRRLKRTKPFELVQYILLQNRT